MGWRFWRRTRRREELDEEIAHDLRLDAEERLQSGMTRADAEQASRRDFGNILLITEATREVWAWRSLEILAQDVRYGARMLRRRAGFTAVAIATLALGIGINTAVFTAYGVLIARPLDARDPTHMANVALARPSGTTTFRFSYPDYEAYRKSVHAFRDLVAFSEDHVALSSRAGVSANERAAAEASALGRLGFVSSGGARAEY